MSRFDYLALIVRCFKFKSGHETRLDMEKFKNLNLNMTGNSKAINIQIGKVLRFQPRSQGLSLQGAVR